MIYEKISKLMKSEAAAVLSIPLDNDYEEALNILESVHSNGGKVVCSGMGKAGQVANSFATTLSSTGTPAIFLHPSEAQHGDLGVLQSNDVMVLISNSGETKEILELAQLSSNLYPEIPRIVITGRNISQLEKMADACIFTGGPLEICPYNMTPTTSTTVMSVICDILVVLLMERINFTKEDYAKRHHSGYLGSKAREEDSDDQLYGPSENNPPKFCR